MAKTVLKGICGTCGEETHAFGTKTKQVACASPECDGVVGVSPTGQEKSKPATHKASEMLISVLEPIEWPCTLEHLRPGPAIVIATPRKLGRLIFKTEYTENEKIVAYNEAGEYLCMDGGTIVQAVYLSWREN